jgi:outer membrane murein-binding lipoprotein Lpp
VSKVEELDSKVRQVIEQLTATRRENQRLRTEVDSLKGHVTLLSGENQKAQQILAQYEHLRRVHDQVTNKVERALTTLNNLRGAA